MEKASVYRNIAWFLAIAGLAVFAFSAFAYRQWIGSGVSTEPSTWGTFGDFIGGFAGSIIALLTLIALAITLQLQAKELQATAAALKEQARLAGEQQSLSYFFELLRERREVIEAWITRENGTRGRLGLAEDATSLRIHSEGFQRPFDALARISHRPSD